MTSADPNTVSRALTIYPPYCHALSPTIGKWVPLRAIDVHSLRDVHCFVDGKKVFHFNNHPIRYVRITGVIVAIDEFTQRRVYTLDDSSGTCIECVCPVPAPELKNLSISTNQRGYTKPDVHNNSKPPPQSKPQEKPPQPSTDAPWIPWHEMDVGVVVKIKGKPAQFRDEMQVEIVKAEVMRGTEQEVKCWQEVGTFRRDVLDKVWIVEREAEEKLKKKAEGRRVEGAHRRTVSGNGGTRGRPEEGRKRKREMEKDAEKRNQGGKGNENRKGSGAEGLGKGNKVNYPSLAVRKQIAEQSKGKYDALGI